MNYKSDVLVSVQNNQDLYNKMHSMSKNMAWHICSNARNTETTLHSNPIVFTLCNVFSHYCLYQDKMYIETIKKTSKGIYVHRDTLIPCTRVSTLICLPNVLFKWCICAFTLSPGWKAASTLSANLCHTNSVACILNWIVTMVVRAI